MWMIEWIKKAGLWGSHGTISVTFCMEVKGWLTYKIGEEILPKVSTP